MSKKCKHDIKTVTLKLSRTMSGTTRHGSLMSISILCAKCLLPLDLSEREMQKSALVMSEDASEMLRELNGEPPRSGAKPN